MKGDTESPAEKHILIQVKLGICWTMDKSWNWQAQFNTHFSSEIQQNLKWKGEKEINTFKRADNF